MTFEAGEADQVQIMRDPRFDFGARHARHGQPEGRIVVDGFPRQQPEMLKDQGNPVRRAQPDRLAVHEKSATAEIGQARNAAQERGLAAARGTNDAHDLVASDTKRQLMERDHGAIEEKLAGALGEDGCINGCVRAHHRFLIHAASEA